MYLYENGVQIGTSSGTARNVTQPADTLAVGYDASGASAWSSSTKFALLRISATAPTADQIAKIYNDEKLLFQPNAKATLDGTSDAVTALAHDPETDLLHVGTNQSRSVFYGLRRINETGNAVTTPPLSQRSMASSRSNDMAVTVSRETHPRVTLKGANSGTVNSGILVGSGDGNRVSMTFTATAEPIIVIPEGPVSDAQLEAGVFETSYIPNTADSGTVTRSPDIASIPVSAFGYNQQAGTVVVEFDSNGSNGSDFPRIFSLTNTTKRDLVRFLINPGNTTAVTVKANNVFVGLDGWSGTISPNAKATIAVAIKEDDFAASLSGASTRTDTSGNMPAAADFLAIGTQKELSGRFLNGHIKSLKYYPRRLTDAQLQELTS
jgi:hypothetical protein